MMPLLLADILRLTTRATPWLLVPSGSGIFHAMSTLAEIEAAVETLPRPQQETLLRHLVVRLGGEVPASFSIVTDADGLPVIRARGGVITPALVREIEGLAR